jgi:putative ABC transport system substrate-binding protein
LGQRLHELGWIAGRTVAIEQRYAEGRSDRYDEIAAEFVRLKVDVIVTTGPAAQQVRRATSVVPIVLPLSGDPRPHHVQRDRIGSWEVSGLTVSVA